MIYAAPAYLIILKINIDSAIIRESPNAANSVCTMLPVPMPSADTIPAFLPCAMLRDRIKMVSFPGVIFNSIPVSKKVSK